MSKKPRGRHVGDGTPEVAKAVFPELQEPAADGERVTQYQVYGDPAKDAQVKINEVLLGDAHPLLELTGTIAGVDLRLYGDGSTFLIVTGYDLADAAEQWNLAANDIGGYRLMKRPPDAVPEIVIQTDTGPVRLVPGGIWEHTQAGQTAVAASDETAVAQPAVQETTVFNPREDG